MTDEEIKAIKEIFDFHKKQILSQFSTDVPDTNVGDTISRQAAINALSCLDDYEEQEIETLRKLPSAQPERKKGKWIHGIEIAREYLCNEIIHIEYKDYHCSECGYTVENIRWNVDGELLDRYCTVCGAQMEVEK